MANTSMLGTEIGAAAVSAYLIQMAQRWSKIPWINEHTKQINFYARVVTSGASALGVGWVWGDLGTTGGHTLTLTIPPAVVILHGLWHWFTQYAVQHGWGNLLSPPITQKAEGNVPTAVIEVTPVKP